MRARSPERLARRRAVLPSQVRRVDDGVEPGVDARAGERVGEREDLSRVPLRKTRSLACLRVGPSRAGREVELLPERVALDDGGGGEAELVEQAGAQQRALARTGRAHRQVERRRILPHLAGPALGPRCRCPGT